MYTQIYTHTHTHTHTHMPFLLQDCNSPHVSTVYITPHTANNFNLQYFIIIHILFYYSAVNFN